jgi:hypothetical protein
MVDSDSVVLICVVHGAPMHGPLLGALAYDPTIHIKRGRSNHAFEMLTNAAPEQLPSLTSSNVRARKLLTTVCTLAAFLIVATFLSQCFDVDVRL